MQRELRELHAERATYSERLGEAEEQRKALQAQLARLKGGGGSEGGGGLKGGAGYSEQMRKRFARLQEAKENECSTLSQKLQQAISA